jgi:colanic acid biosynthesis glycosyl transferase WcaI
VVERARAGITVTPDDPEVFTKAVDRLVSDPDEAKRMGAAGRAFVEKWASPGAVAAQYEALFQELIASP